MLGQEWGVGGEVGEREGGEGDFVKDAVGDDDEAFTFDLFGGWRENLLS